MEVEQHSVIKFFSDEGMPGIQIVARLRQHYGEGALSRTQVYFWINEAKRGERILTLLQAPEESLTKILPLLLLASSMPILASLSARKLAQSLGIAASTGCRHLIEVLGMKCRHLRWVSHTLTLTQK
jgi:hypothetical protein